MGPKVDVTVTKFDFVIIAIPRRALTTLYKQRNKQPVALFTILVKGWQQENACKSNQSSNNCVQTIRYNCAPFSSFVQQRHFLALCQPEPMLFMRPLH
jgi:hypothetical protein